jgi:hypothetical protein
MRKERKPYFNDVQVFTFCNAILLMCVGTTDKVGNPNASKKGLWLLIFRTPISLHGNNLSVQESLNMLLGILEFRKHFRYVLQKKYPSKFGVVINEAYIIAEFASRARSRPPHIQKNKLKRSFRHTSRSRKWQLMRLSTLTCITNSRLTRRCIKG